MNISEAARQSKLSSKTIRYYEDIGLIKPSRAENGYRDYSVDDTHRLAFIQRSRSLGFSVDECRLLLSLYEDDERASADVKRLALAKISEIEAKINELESLKRTLASLAHNCQGDDRPECPIMDDLMGKH